MSNCNANKCINLESRGPSHANDTITRSEASGKSSLAAEFEAESSSSDYTVGKDTIAAQFDGNRQMAQLQELEESLQFKSGIKRSNLVRKLKEITKTPQESINVVPVQVESLSQQVKGNAMDNLPSRFLLISEHTRQRSKTGQRSAVRKSEDQFGRRDDSSTLTGANTRKSAINKGLAGGNSTLVDNSRYFATVRPLITKCCSEGQNVDRKNVPKWDGMSMVSKEIEKEVTEEQQEASSLKATTPTIHSITRSLSRASIYPMNDACLTSDNLVNSPVSGVSIPDTPKPQQFVDQMPFLANDEISIDYKVISVGSDVMLINDAGITYSDDEVDYAYDHKEKQETDYLGLETKMEATCLHNLFLNNSINNLID